MLFEVMKSEQGSTIRVNVEIVQAWSAATVHCALEHEHNTPLWLPQYHTEICITTFIPHQTN